MLSRKKDFCNTLELYSILKTIYPCRGYYDFSQKFVVKRRFRPYRKLYMYIVNRHPSVGLPVLNYRDGAFPKVLFFFRLFFFIAIYIFIHTLPKFQVDRTNTLIWAFQVLFFRYFPLKCRKSVKFFSKPRL